MARPTKASKGTIEINFDKTLFSPLFYPLLFDESRYLVMKGGAGSGKSYFAAQYLIWRSLTERNNRFVCVRKVGNTIRKSQWKLLNDLIKQYKLGDYFSARDTDMTLTCALTNTEIISVGMDDKEKIKSIAEITSIWYEEPTELSQQEFLQMSMRLRGIKENKMQELLTFNPISDRHWIKSFFFTLYVEEELRKGKQVARTKKVIDIPDEEPLEVHTTIVHSTYKDNLFIDRQYKAQLENLKEVDFNYYNIYCLGNWGVLGEKVFSGFTVLDEFPPDDYYDEIVYGLDFGWVHPSALVRVGIKDSNAYVTELMYQSKLTKQQIAEYIVNNNLVTDGGIIYCDASEPDAVEVLKDMGLDARSAFRGGALGNNSVLMGIEMIKAHNMFTLKDNINLNREVQEYKFKSDADGNILTDDRGLPKILRLNDDCLSALRYAMYSTAKKSELKMAFI